MCRALAAVHRAEIIHRDIKAQNVMRASDGGRIILMDFGAGEFIEKSASSRGQGTPLYLAPEILEAKAPAYKAISTRWAFSCTIWSPAASRCGRVD